MYTNKKGKTPLYMSSEEGHIEVVKYLAGEGQEKDAFIQKKEFGWSPLHVSAWRGHLEVVKYLVEENKFVGINTTDNQTRTPLQVAENNCYEFADCSRVVRYLKDTEKKKEGESSF